MELKAILYVMIKYGVNINNPLYGLTEKEPIVYSDSSYCVNIFNDWMFNWAKNGWIKSSDKKPPENLEIIKTYYDLYQQGFRIDLRKVKGYANNKYNNLADELATNKITEEEVFNGRK
jgi:ribonuclease HI